MACKVDFRECLTDSPLFRETLNTEEINIDNLENKLTQIIKICTLAVDSGKEYIRNQSNFATSLWDLQQHFQDKTSHNALAKIIHQLQEMNKFHTILLDQCSRTVLKNLSTFLKKDVKEVKEYKQIFTKVSENLDVALYKNSQVNKNRALEVTETENYVSANKSCFRHSSLDYVNLITMLQTKKKPEILSTLLSFINACSTYYHQGHDLCEDYGPFFKELDDEISTMRLEYNQLEKQMQNRHTFVNNFVEDLPTEPPRSPEPASSSTLANGEANKRKNVRMEGYLFKRTSNAFKTWNRRWFYLKDNKLFYKKRTGEELPTIMEDDLRLCTVRPLMDSDRRFCFEVISPTKSHILQCDSESNFNAWVKALHDGINQAIQHDSPFSRDILGGSGARQEQPRQPPNVKKINWRQILRIPGNSKCADCANPDPKWSSINLGITLCISCSGVHRSLGVHYSKVRSLTLDVWEPEILRVMIELGNEVVNKVYEGNYHSATSDVERATENCEQSVREKWIKAKYIDKRFVLPFFSHDLDLDFSGIPLMPPSKPNKWSLKKIRRRSCRRSSTNNNVKGTKKELNGVPEKDVNDDILILGEFITDTSDILTTTGLFSLSDQESTSGEEEVMDEEEIDKLNPNFVLFKASSAHNLPVMGQAMSLGADKNWANEDVLNRTPLHQAIQSGSVMACEYLLLNGAKIDQADQLGYAPLHLAIETGNTSLAYLLLKHKAKYDLPTKDGKKPIDIAIETANADVVTLLRLTQLNDEIGVDGEDLCIGGDSTYNDVMRDFSHLTCNQPQKLSQQRNKGTHPTLAMSATNDEEDQN